MLRNQQISYSWQTIFCLGLLFLCCAAGSFIPSVGDFANYYYGSAFLVDGSASEVLYHDIHAFNEKITTTGSVNHFCNYLPVPPFSLLFYAPFSFMEIHLSKFIFNLLSVLFLGYTYIRLNKRFEFSIPQSLLVFICLLLPLYQNIVQGQAYIFMVCCMFLAFDHEKESPTTAGALVALATMLKIIPIVMLVYFIWKRNFRAIVSFVFFLSILVGFSFVFVGAKGCLHYIQAILPRLLSGQVIDPYYYGHQGAMIMLRDLFVRDEWSNPSVIWDLPEMAYFLEGSLISLVGLIVFAARKTKDELLYLSLIITGMFLVSSYVTVYSLFLLLPLAIWSVSNSQKWLTVIIVLALNFPLIVLKDFPFPLQYIRWFLMLTIFLILLNKAKYTWKPVGHTAFIIAGGLFYVLFCIKGPSDYLLPTEKKMLYYQISRFENSLILHSCEGTAHASDTLRDIRNERINTIEAIEESEKLGESGTNTSTSQTFLINNKWQVYLSDEGQGVGFNKPRIRSIHE